MSKRFGRNQRRRMREQIAALSEAHERESTLLRHTGQKLRDAQDEIEDAKRALTPHFVGFKPQIMGGHDANSQLMMASTPPLRFEVEAQAPETLTFARIPLDVMTSYVDKRHIDFSRHVIVHFRDGRWGYAITEKAWREAPEDYLIRLVSQQLARQIVADLRGK